MAAAFGGTPSQWAAEDLTMIATVLDCRREMREQR